MINPDTTKFEWYGSIGEGRLYKEVPGSSDPMRTLRQIHQHYDAQDRYVFVRPEGQRNVLVIDMHTIYYHPDVHREWMMDIDYLAYRTFPTLDVAIAQMATRYEYGI